MTRPILVTSALPYASGPPHFGHLVGAYLPADIFVRYHRMIGSDVLYMCGTDEHGVAITLAAEQEGVTYQELVDRWHDVWLKSCNRLGIQFDNFSQTSRPDPHYDLSREFFQRILKNGRLLHKETTQLYSPKTGRFLADRYVRGKCYECGYPDARGDECPQCGTWLDTSRMTELRSAQDPDDQLEKRDAWQYELDLSKFPTDPVSKKWLESVRDDFKVNVKRFVFDKMIEGEGLHSRPITRDLPWGVPLPRTDLDGKTLEDIEGKVLYVWFDAPIGYISATIEWARREGRDWRRYWIRKRGAGPDEGARLIHFIGKDNIPFHCIVFPAMLAWQTLDETPEGMIGPGNDEEYVLPENIPANEFFNLEGKKFNKGEGWYLDVDGFIEKYGTDRTRYYLASAMPETADSDFLWREFKARTDELANVFGNFAVRILKFINTHFENVVPPRVGYDEELQRVQASIQARTEAFAREIESYHFRKALLEFRGLADDGNLFINDLAPWKLRKDDPEACGSVLNIALQFLPPLSVLAAPFIPEFSDRLRSMLNIPARPAGPLLPAEIIEAGHQLGQPEVLFEKIPSEQIEAETQTLVGSDS